MGGKKMERGERVGAGFVMYGILYDVMEYDCSLANSFRTPGWGGGESCVMGGDSALLLVKFSSPYSSL